MTPNEFVQAKAEALKKQRDYNQGQLDVLARIKANIHFLRQWLNEDRIDDPKKMVTDEEIEYWLFD
jgi:hypothetical protein